MKIIATKTGKTNSIGLRCINEFEGVPHYKPSFVKLAANRFKCIHCEVVNVFGQPYLETTTDGKVEMKVDVSKA